MCGLFLEGVPLGSLPPAFTSRWELSALPLGPASNIINPKPLEPVALLQVCSDSYRKYSITHQPLEKSLRGGCGTLD